MHPSDYSRRPRSSHPRRSRLSFRHVLRRPGTGSYSPLIGCDERPMTCGKIRVQPLDREDTPRRLHVGRTTCSESAVSPARSCSWSVPSPGRSPPLRVAHHLPTLSVLTRQIRRIPIQRLRILLQHDRPLSDIELDDCAARGSAHHRHVTERGRTFSIDYVVGLLPLPRRGAICGTEVWVLLALRGDEHAWCGVHGRRGWGSSEEERAATRRTEEPE